MQQRTKFDRVMQNWKSRFQNLDKLVLVILMLITGMLAVLSVLRYLSYNARMFDLGHMAQAIWSSTRGRPLEFSYRGELISRLSLHVELVYFLLTPLYALFPSPITLLLFQAILFGLGGVPLYRLARRRTGSLHAARLITLVYLLYPTAQTAVLFDFHGDTLAMPLFLFAFEALDRKAWGSYGVWLLLALSCKVYIAAPVCGLGVFLWLKGHRRVGGLTCLGGLIWGAVIFFGVRPFFSDSTVGVQQATAGGYAQFYFGELFSQFTATWAARVAHGLAVFAPLIPIAIYALDWVGLSLLVALPVLLSTGPGPSFHYGAHHYAMVVPFLIQAVLHAVVRLNTRASITNSGEGLRKQRVTWPFALGATVVMTILVNSQLVNTPFSPQFWSRRIDDGQVPWVYDRTERDALKDLWLMSNVPDEVSLLASTLLAPHLAQRRDLHVARPADGNPDPLLTDLFDKADYIVLDGLLDYVEQGAGDSLVSDVTYDWDVLTAALHRSDFGLINAWDGLLLFEKRPSAITETNWVERTLLQELTSGAASVSPTYTEFESPIGLVESTVTHMHGRCYRLQYVWLALDGISENPPLFGVTELVGVDHARILHLPTIALHPTTAWQPGELITETFEVRLPEALAPGRYPLTVAWYDATHTFAYATDERSRTGASASVGVLEVAVSAATE